jgi:hypothetical protein
MAANFSASEAFFLVSTECRSGCRILTLSIFLSSRLSPADGRELASRSRLGWDPANISDGRFVSQREEDQVAALWKELDLARCRKVKRNGHERCQQARTGKRRMKKESPSARSILWLPNRQERSAFAPRTRPEVRDAHWETLWQMLSANRGRSHATRDFGG